MHVTASLPYRSAAQGRKLSPPGVSRVGRGRASTRRAQSNDGDEANEDLVNSRDLSSWVRLGRASWTKNRDRGHHERFVTPPPGDGLLWPAGVDAAIAPVASLGYALNRFDRGRLSWVRLGRASWTKNRDRGHHERFVAPPPGDGLLWSSGVDAAIAPVASLGFALNRFDRGRRGGQTSRQTSQLYCPAANPPRYVWPTPQLDYPSPNPKRIVLPLSFFFV